MAVEEPPFYSPVINNEAKFLMPWVLFVEQMFKGDPGDPWVPTFQNLTTSGTPTITGRVYRLSQYLTFFTVRIVPGTSTTSTAGTTYIDNYPLLFNGDGLVFAVSGGVGSNSGHIVASTNRIYTPPWSGVTVPLTLLGIGVIS